MKPFSPRAFAFLGFLVLCFVAFRLGSDYPLTLGNLKSHIDTLRSFYRANPIQTYAYFTAIFTMITALSVPGLAIVGLAGGALFGFWGGFIVPSFGATLGATLAFLSSRYFLRDGVQKKFQPQLKKINAGFKKEGRYYLFSLRLVPIIPFFMTNILMGLTSISTRDFSAITWAGMLPGIAVTVNAGIQLQNIQSPLDIVTPQLLGSFALIALLPLLTKKALAHFSSKKTS
jgi:uncharacterized membrane protein YdjX (TVP38/TMEM64 family)